MNPLGDVNGPCNTYTSSATASKPLRLADIMEMHRKLRLLPLPLSVVYATRAASDRIRTVEVPTGLCVMPSLHLVTFGRAIVRLVTFETIAECQEACRQAIEAGVHAATLTEDVFFDPVEGAREFEKMERQNDSRTELVPAATPQSGHA